MGATVSEILVLLGKGFTMLVIISLILAIPLSYFGMELWLENFAYQGSIQVWPFIVAGLMALFIAWATICYQTIKAALANPVDSLRHE